MADDNPFSDPSLQAADSSARQEELPSWATAPADGLAGDQGHSPRVANGRPARGEQQRVFPSASHLAMENVSQGGPAITLTTRPCRIWNCQKWDSNCKNRRRSSREQAYSLSNSVKFCHIESYYLRKSKKIRSYSVPKIVAEI